MADLFRLTAKDSPRKALKEVYFYWGHKIFLSAGGNHRSTWGKPAKASLGWKPIAHSASGLGIEPGMDRCKVREVPVYYLYQLW